MSTALIITVTAILLLFGVGLWIMVQRGRPKHTFIAWDPGMRSAQPYKRKTQKGRIRVKGADGKLVMFPMQPEFVLNRQDGKGTVVWGDMSTGRLMRPQQDGTWVAMDGIFSEAALADGRVESLARATRGTGLTLQHIMWGLAIVGGLVCIVIYQFAKATSGG